MREHGGEPASEVPVREPPRRATRNTPIDPRPHRCGKTSFELRRGVDRRSESVRARRTRSESVREPLSAAHHLDRRSEGVSASASTARACASR